MAVEVASSIYVNQLNATKLKSSKNQFQFQFELSLAQLSPSLFYYLLINLVVLLQGPQQYHYIAQVYSNDM